MIQMHILYDNVDINLQANGYRVLDGYYPRTGGSGTERVTDEIPMMISASSGAARSAAMQAILFALTQARRNSSRVWLEFAIDENEDRWRARIFDGNPMLDNRVSTRWRGGVLTMRLLVERDAIWSGPEVQVPLTNDNDSDNLTGLKIYSGGDGAGSSPNKRVNYVEIAADSVDGDLPGLTRLELTNTYSNGTDMLQTLWIGQSWSIEDYVNFPHILEAEDAVSPVALLTDTLSATASGGYYGAVGPIGAGQNTDIYWTLSDDQANALRGANYKLMYVGPVGGAWAGWDTTRFMPYISWFDGSYVLSDRYFDPTILYSIRDTGTVRLPPYLENLDNFGSINLYLRFYNMAAGNVTPQIDYLALLPADGFRYVQASVGYNKRLVDDGIEGRSYLDDGAGADVYGIRKTGGERILLMPNRLQRLYFMMHSNNPSDFGMLDMTASVKLFYRPRRLAL